MRFSWLKGRARVYAARLECLVCATTWSRVLVRVAFYVGDCASVLDLQPSPKKPKKKAVYFHTKLTRRVWNVGGNFSAEVALLQELSYFSGLFPVLQNEVPRCPSLPSQRPARDLCSSDGGSSCEVVDHRVHGHYNWVRVFARITTSVVLVSHSGASRALREARHHRRRVGGRAWGP